MILISPCSGNECARTFYWDLFLGDYFPRVGLRPAWLELVQALRRESWRPSTRAKIELVSACLKSLWRHRTGIPFVSHRFFLLPPKYAIMSIDRKSRMEQYLRINLDG